MRARSRSVGSRILLPVLLLSAGTVAALLAVALAVTERVREDYDHFTLTTATSHVATVLDLATSELVALHLAENPVVVDAKKLSVRASLQDYWSGSGLEGLILARDGTVVASSMSPPHTRAAVAACRDASASLKVDDVRVHCQPYYFPLWGWTAVTIARHAPLRQLRPELVYLPAALVIGAVALTAAVLLLLWRTLGGPVATMVADVAAGRPVRGTGLRELDRIGDAVNGAVERLHVRTRELAEALERRHDAEEALRERDARIRLLLDSTAEGIYGVDAEGICTFCNPAALRQLGLTQERELLGRNLHAVVHHTRADGTPYPEEQCPIRVAHREQRVVRVADEVFWRPDGSRFPVEYWACPVIDRGEVTGTVVGFLDITERQALEEQLRQSQKMEAVGRLAGGIAHDFNNMLMAIVGFANVARDEAEPDSAQRHYAEQVLIAASKATELTRQILAFSRKQPMSPAPTDVNAIIRGMGKLLARLLGEDVELVQDLTTSALVALVDRAGIEQVLMNLWANARDAMPGGGRLTVTTQEVSCDGETAARLGLEAPGRYALITVSDNGAGMDETTSRRIFEPFFTTKELGKGTGLGLSIVYGIVRQHHGQIGVTSAPGRGTTFRIHLPLTEGRATGPAAEPPAAVRGGSETVLVAEDNDEVRALARTVLTGAGYRVLVARDGLEAERLHEAHADEIGLCLFDVVMPRRGGIEALRGIRARRPGARAILMSGYTPELGAEGTEGTLLLTKPFAPRELLRRVREALDA